MSVWEFNACLFGLEKDTNEKPVEKIATDELHGMFARCTK